MAFRGFSWSAPFNLGVVTLFLLLLVVSESVGDLLQDSVIFNTNDRGSDLSHSSNQPLDYLSAYVHLDNFFKFAGSGYDSIGVSSHGLLYFGEEREINLPGDLQDDDFAGLFPLLQRTDITLGGSVKYLYIPAARTDELGQKVEEALADFLSGTNVEWLFVVTWEKVQAWSSLDPRVTNTFQVVLAGDGHKTFAIFNYERISWTKSTFQDGVEFDAQAGFIDGVSSTSFYLPGSGAHKILFLQGKSNVDVRGRWIYDVTHFLPDVYGAVPCVPNPCANGGTCKAGECSCPVGYGGLKCEEDFSHVECDSTTMKVVLDKRLLPENSQPSDVHFLSQDEGCLAYDFDSNRIKLSTRYNKCGTTMQEDDDNIIFRNFVTFAKPTAGDGGMSISRQYHKQIQIECCLSKVSVLTGNFQPKVSKITINDKDLGLFSLKIARFTDDEFDTEESVDDGGVIAEGRVTLGSKLYFGVVLDSTPVVGVVIKSCWATGGGPDSVPRHDLINNQCPAEDSTVEVTHELSLDREGFSFDAFRFTDEISGITEVFIYCDVVVCSSTEAEEARAEECLSPGPGPISRRDVSSSSRHTVSYGPVSIYSPDTSFSANSQESDSVFGTRTYIIGIVVLVSMVTIWGVVKGCGYRFQGSREERAFLIDAN